MLHLRFGPFARVFRKGELDVPGHLVLLSLREPDVEIVLKRVDVALRSGGRQKHLDRMLRSANWRPHLVAAVAYLMDSERRYDPGQLWTAIDSGSWVTPQLLVTARLVDPAYSSRARARVSAGIAIAEPGPLSPVGRHSATGPAGTSARIAKLAASLLGVDRLLPTVGLWDELGVTSQELQSLCETDMDESAMIISGWLEAIRLRLGERGLPILPAST